MKDFLHEYTLHVLVGVTLVIMSAGLTMLISINSNVSELNKGFAVMQVLTTDRWTGKDHAAYARQQELEHALINREIEALKTKRAEK